MKKLINKLLDLLEYNPDVSQIPEPTPEPEPTLDRDPFKPLPKPEEELPSGSQTYTLYSTPYPSEGHRIGELTVEWRLVWAIQKYNHSLTVPLAEDKCSEKWRKYLILKNISYGCWVEENSVVILFGRKEIRFYPSYWAIRGTTKEEAIAICRSLETLELDNGAIINGADIKHMEPKQ